LEEVKMKRATILLTVALATPLLFAVLLKAQVPHMINYQGVLTDPTTGGPIPDNSYSITFTIYSVATGGTALWTEVQNVSTTGGRFNVLLGSVNPIPPTVFSGGNCYLGVKVETDAEMTPRKRMVSVGYALKSHDADKVGG
jgi:hypothetical protein